MPDGSIITEPETNYKENIIIIYKAIFVTSDETLRLFE